jgi:putative spermidine/putrescine transport system permease protein
MTMAISTTLGTMSAIFLSRVKFRGQHLSRAFFLSPLILPGIILGLALYVFYATTFTWILRTIPGLLLGHVLVTTPFVIGTVLAALANYDVSLEDAARSLGAGPLKAFRKVTLPNISNGVMAGSIFAFIVSFGQFDISLFLSAPNFTPLPMAMYYSLRYRFEPTAAAAGIFAITLVTVSMIVTSKLISLKKFSGVKFS